MSTDPSQKEDTTDSEEVRQLTFDGEVVETDRAENTPATGGKLHRIITKYGFTELGDRLERKYTPPNPAALRELKQMVNVKILDQNMRGALTTEEDYEDCRHRLTADDRELTEGRLNKLGIDGEEVLGDMIAHGTVQNYLRTYRDVEKQGRRQNTPEESAKSMIAIRKKVEMVLKNRVSSHSERDKIPTEPEIDVKINVFCPDCDESISAVDLLRLQQCPRCI
ncbi:rod-determining factor RdfA [Halorubrum ezzemoulense]|uniref:rod-determining factor RdfA n=1 Tax=Halorubrum ezzemoulense TaxID=337243 RepID=UPI0023311D14|nr:rod-determining factor RdfA [Halorubrum ezzemoulense]MDB2242687.1 hypothetical protein [Halorubrum ezzemoulense]